MKDARGYWLCLSQVQGIGPGRMKRLLDEFGSARAAWSAPVGRLHHAGLPEDVIHRLLDWRRNTDPGKELEKLARSGYRFLIWDDPEYPARLKEIDYPPAVLYVWGTLAAEDEVAVAIVGTRRASPYGREVAREIASVLAASGVTIVSGLARGVDGIAHRAALDAGGRTVAVLGSGLDQVYPPEHRKMAELIAGAGAVVSDYPIGTRPEGGNFPPRNRIITGLSMAVVVVEAGESSGALISADFAAEQGRDVFAVPGRINESRSRGTNKLIAAGAFPLLSPQDVLEALNLEMVAMQEVASRNLPADPVERALIQALGDHPLHIDELSRVSGLPAASISASLAMLELKGRVRQVGGMHFVLVKESPSSYEVG